jgi:(2Fe-2S) ferredoxin
MKYRKHLFICTNQRSGSDRRSCGEAHGLELVKEFKRLIKERGLNVEIRAQRAGCMDVCELGPALVVYPEGVFYGPVALADVPEIVESHLANNVPVARLTLRFNATQP